MVDCPFSRDNLGYVWVALVLIRPLEIFCCHSRLVPLSVLLRNTMRHSAVLDLMADPLLGLLKLLFSLGFELLKPRLLKELTFFVVLGPHLVSVEGEHALPLLLSPGDVELSQPIDRLLVLHVVIED